MGWLHLVEVLRYCFCGLIRCRKVGCLLYFNPCMPNVFSHPYQLDQSISNFWVVGFFFNFYSKFKRNFCKQTVENLIRRRVLNAASDLVLHCLPMSHKNDVYGLSVLLLSCMCICLSKASSSRRHGLVCECGRYFWSYSSEKGEFFKLSIYLIRIDAVFNIASKWTETPG